MALKVRILTAEEANELKRLAGSRTVPHRAVQRAQIVWASAHGEPVPAMARRVGLSACRVRAWIHRLNRHGLSGFTDAPRAGRPRQHDETTRGAVIALARTKPRSVGWPFALWTLARRQQVLQERHGLLVTPATIWQGLRAEGLVWTRPPSWFQVTVDAAFTEKRGPSSRPTRSRSQSAGHRPRRTRTRKCQDLSRGGRDVRSRPGDVDSG
jgi:transposase